MDVWKTILGLARRKRLVLPLLVAALGLAALTVILVPTRYVSSTTMVLTTPTGGGTLSQDPARPTGLTNPLLNFDEGLKTAATIVIHAVNTPERMAALGMRDGSATKITIDDGRSNLDLLGTNGPFVYIQSEDSTPDAARDVVIHAQELVRTELDERQKALGAPPSTFIKVVDVVSPSAPEPVLGTKWQTAGATFVLCIALGLAGAYAVQRRRERRSRLDDAPPAAELVHEPDGIPLFQPHHPVTNGNGTRVNGATARRWPARLSPVRRPASVDPEPDAPRNGTAVKTDPADEPTVPD